MNLPVHLGFGQHRSSHELGDGGRYGGGDGDGQLHDLDILNQVMEAAFSSVSVFHWDRQILQEVGQSWPQRKLDPTLVVISQALLRW